MSRRRIQLTVGLLPDMLKNTTFKDNGTYINGKKVSTSWTFISDGTWYDKGTKCQLEDDCLNAGGIFRGKRGGSDEDKELCSWCEFTIHDDQGNLIQEAYYGWDGPKNMAFI